MVDTEGRGLTLDNHPASVQDRVASATAIRVEIVRKPKDQVGFAVHARRWVVERFFAWIGRNRRPAKASRPPSSANAFLYAASVIILLRRVAHSE